MYNKGTARNKFFTALVFAVAVIVAYSFLFFIILNENRVLASLVAKVDSEKTEKDALSSLKDRVEETEVGRGEITDYFIPKDGVVPFLNRIQALGEENFLNLKVSEVDIEDSPMWEDSFESVKMKVQVVGEWQDVYNFVSLIDLLPLKIIVDRMDLEKVIEGTSSDGAKKKTVTSGEWRGIMEVRVFKFK